jgi:hypothetical protein
MPRELDQITKKDLEWLALGKKVLKVIKSKKDWGRFKKYMKVYYEK